MTHRLLKLVSLAVLLAAAPMFIHAGDLHEFIIHDSTTRALKMLEEDSSLIESRDATNFTPLHYAAQFARTNVVKWLIKHKASVNARGDNEFTPMHLAKNGEIAKLLIAGGADLNLKDGWGRTPLQRAALMGNRTVVNAILDSGFHLDLTSALILRKLDDAKRIIKRDPAAVKIVEPNKDLWANISPLGIAAGNGDKEIVEMLLQNGAPVNAVTQSPTQGAMTPLCNAVWGGHLEIAEMLCMAGADCNVTGGKFYPHLLDFAKAHSDPKMVELLTRHGAKPGE